MDTNRHLIRSLVRGAYDIQKLRISIGLRVVANFKVKQGFAPGVKEEENEDREAGRMLKRLVASHKKITGEVVELSRRKAIDGDGIIDNRVEYDLVNAYVRLLQQEEQHFKSVGHALKEIPIWRDFLEGVKGVGPAMAGVLISEIDISKARYASSLWKYAGLDVCADGKGRSRRKEHLVDAEYTDSEGKPATRKSITYNPFLKTKLMGVLASSFLRSKSPYADLYYEYKLRLENNPKHQEKSKGHRHNMAMRRMVKLFLVDLYVAWREIEGLPVEAPYSEGKLGIVHGVASIQASSGNTKAA